MIDRFQHDPKVPPNYDSRSKAGGVGSNFINQRFFHFDRWWNPAKPLLIASSHCQTPRPGTRNLSALDFRRKNSRND